MKGNEDINIRLLHVYRSKKRAGTDHSDKSQSVASRQTKRKAKAVGNESRKKTKLFTRETEIQVASAFQGALFASPCPSQLSFDFDANLDLDKDNLFGTKDTPINAPFGTKCTPGNTTFSFMPVEEVRSSFGIENTMLNNPAFNSAVAKAPANFQPQYVASSGYNYGQCQARYPTLDRGSGINSHCKDWVRSAPSIPKLSPSGQKERLDTDGREFLNVSDFSQMLKDLEERLLTDVRCSNSADQVIKLQVLQSWAKEVSRKPLQLQTEARGTVEVSAVAKSNAPTQVAIKLESPETPRITP